MSTYSIVVPKDFLRSLVNGDEVTLQVIADEATEATEEASEGTCEVVDTVAETTEENCEATDVVDESAEDASEATDAVEETAKKRTTEFEKEFFDLFAQLESLANTLKRGD